MSNLCNYDLNTNECEILYKRLQQEVCELAKSMNEKFLCQDNKIAETCIYLKENLSNECRALFDELEKSGELTSIINQALLTDHDVYVTDFGAIGDGLCDESASFQKAIDFCLENRVGKLIIPSGNYRIHNTLEITLKDRYFNFEIVGEGYPHILPITENFNGDYLLHIKANAKTMNDFKRYLTIRDIVFGHDGDNTQADITAIFMQETQYVNFDNIMIRGFKKSGLILRDVFDSMFHNVRILNCGDVSGTNTTEETYAMILQGDLDNTNACHFYGLHIENSPLMLKIQSKNRHNTFTDCKFEQTKGNFTEFSPIFIDGRSGENIFSNCMFVKNSLDGNNENQYMITTSEATNIGLSTMFHALFKGCMFACSTSAKNTGHWFNVDCCVIESCIFHNTGGNGNGFGGFRFVANNIFKNNKVYMTSWNTNTFKIKGENNMIKDNIISYMAGDEINAGSFLEMDSAYANNVIEGNNIKGNPFSPYVMSDSYFGNTIIRNNVPHTKTIISTANGEPVILYGSDVMVIDYKGTLPIYKFRYGYNGQHLKVLFTDELKTLMHNDSALVLKGGTNYTPQANEVVEFVNYNGIWYQV